MDHFFHSFLIEFRFVVVMGGVVGDELAALVGARLGLAAALPRPRAAPVRRVRLAEREPVHHQQLLTAYRRYVSCCWVAYKTIVPL